MGQGHSKDFKYSEVESRFEGDRRLRQVEFIFSPNPTEDWQAQEWGAWLRVKCDDVARLMRKGFVCNSRNLVNDEGFIIKQELVTQTRPDHLKWAGMRTYFFAEKHWVARLDVYALHLDTLHHFDLARHISRERIGHVIAFNGKERRIYLYVATDGEQRNFNVICGDMPLQGLWPRTLKPEKSDDKNGSTIEGIDPDKKD